MNRPSLPSEGPSELVQRIQSGADRDAEARLVEGHSRGVRLVLARHTRNASEAEDLFQETFGLAVMKLRAGELRDPSKLGSFLGSLARNLATEHYRRAGRRKTEADSEVAEAVAHAAEGQLGSLLRSEEARLVRQTLADLSVERDREILFRFYIADEDKESIAAEFGLSSLQFNRILHRARQRYKGHYLARLARREGPGEVSPAVLLLLLVVVSSAVVSLLVPLER